MRPRKVKRPVVMKRATFEMSNGDLIVFDCQSDQVIYHDKTHVLRLTLAQFINIIAKAKARRKEMDKTEYARSIGYTGEKPVIVEDGKVVSHGGQDWQEFCDNLRKGGEQ